MDPHAGHRKRLRDRFLKFGLDALEEHEVLELFLFFVIHRKDTKPMGHALIRKYGSLAGVMDAPLHDLEQVEGIGKQAALLLYMIKPLCRRYLLSQSQRSGSLTTAEACAAYLIPHFFGAAEEHVFLLCLDAKCNPICCREISRGTAVNTELPLREATQLALESKAVSVILAHNHPCGDPTPSNEDYRATTNLRKALTPMNIPLVDHFIISGTKYISLAQCGFFLIS